MTVTPVPVLHAHRVMFLYAELDIMQRGAAQKDLLSAISAGRIVVTAEPSHGLSRAMLDVHKRAMRSYSERAGKRDTRAIRVELKRGWHGDDAWKSIEARDGDSRRCKPRPLLRASSKATREVYGGVAEELRQAASAARVPAAPRAATMPSGGAGLPLTTEGDFVPQNHGAVSQLPGCDECPAPAAIPSLAVRTPFRPSEATF